MNTPIDLDAIKAAGLNKSVVSLRLLASHERAERLALHRDLWAKWLRDNPAASADEILTFAARTIEEVLP